MDSTKTGKEYPVTGEKRLANIELLRMAAMMMVIALHFMRESGSILDASVLNQPSASCFWGTFLEAFCIVAVNVYVLISGYMGSGRGFKLSGCIAFLLRIWFYALLIPLVLTCLSVSTFGREQGIYGLSQYLLPIESDTYWFASAYLFLMLFMPLLNEAVKGLKKKPMQMILAGLLLFLCVVKSICPIALSLDHYGYDAVWFLCVYLVGAYLKKYGGGIFERRPWSVYVGSSLLIFLMVCGLWYSLRYFSGAAYYFTVPFHYNFILCLTGAIGLFYGFTKINIREGKMAELIRRGGRYSFGIYLLHEHPDLRHRWYPFLRSILNPAGKEGTGWFFAELIFSITVLFLAGMIIEWIRDFLYTLVWQKGRRVYAEKK